MPNRQEDLRKAGGTIAAAAQTVELSIYGYKGVSARITGTWAGTILAEVSADEGVSWDLVDVLKVVGENLQSSIFSGENGLYNFTRLSGVGRVRLRASAWTSGTANIEIRGNVVALMESDLPHYEESDGNAGKVVAPTAGAAIVTIASGSLPRGTYRVLVTAGLGLGGVPAVADENNMELRKGATVISDLTVVAAVNGAQVQQEFIVELDGTQALSVNAIGAATASVTYNAMLVATRVMF